MPTWEHDRSASAPRCRAVLNTGPCLETARLCYEPILGNTPPLESQSPQTKTSNVLVFLSRQATHTNTPHDDASLSMEDHQPALHRCQVRISHLGGSTALALQALRIGKGILARQCCGVGLAHSHTDRKSTRLNSSHRTISYAVFCLKK